MTTWPKGRPVPLVLILALTFTLSLVRTLKRFSSPSPSLSSPVSSSACFAALPFPLTPSRNLPHRKLPAVGRGLRLRMAVAAGVTEEGPGRLMFLSKYHHRELRLRGGETSKPLSSSSMKPGSRHRCSPRSNVSNKNLEDKEGEGVKDALRIVKKACDALSPLVRSIYYAQTSETCKQKADKSMFTIADGLVQELLISKLFSRVRFKAIVAEEDVQCNIESRPYSVGDYHIPLDSEIAENIEAARETLNIYAQELETLEAKNPIFNGLSLFLDPIDGTKEFVNMKGHCCTICIGFAKDQQAEAGIVYRPIPTPNTWAAGCKSEEYFEHELNEYHDDGGGNNGRSTLLTPSKSSPFLVQLMERLDAEHLAVGGCGHKALLLLERPNTWYILDRGLSRWDTCAAQAVLEAQGGGMKKLTAFCDQNDPSTNNYIYASSSVNLDWNPKARLTPYNARAKAALEGEGVSRLEELLPYANICGIVAYPKTSSKRLQDVETAIKDAASKFDPYYT